ncbi:hypothetical protein L596_026896 [Steinernema carpocapsae]|uniref:SRR1-like domain-containing protein n=1 Tax=Steinernema carpocapsae TaxID=34508 RepID=A0A4U5M2S2_STECR|nr:hypothetical protein L596_026896 [Steinernema carpocapsae]
MRATLKAAEDLLKNIEQSYKIGKARRAGDTRDLILPSLVDDVPTMANILQSALEQLNGRRVRHLKGVWTDLLRTKDRLGNLAVLLALKDGLNPQECSYESPIIPDDEREFLRSLGVSTPEPQDFAEFQIPPFADEHLVDIYFMVGCNWTLVNNFLQRNWNAPELKQILLLHYGIIRRQQSLNSIRETHYALNAIQRALMNFKKLRTENWYSYIRENNHVPFPVSATEFPQTLPENLKNQAKTVYRWCFLPSYLKSKWQFQCLVDMSTFDHVTFNLQMLQSYYQATGFSQEYLADLEKLLEGRRIRRIKILGLGRMDTLNILKQLAFVLAIKDHFGVTEVSSQEPLASEFEKGYLNSIGVATPPHDNCDQPEEGLEEGEVTLFYWHMLNYKLRENVIRANQDRLRKVVIIQDVSVEKGSRWYPLLSEKGKKKMDERTVIMETVNAALQEMRRQKHEERFKNDPLPPIKEGAIERFIRLSESIPLRYDILETTPSWVSFPWCPFFGMEMQSFPKDRLRDE